MPKNLLFITWDGPQTFYMEGLFMPIFHAIQLQSDFKFHVIQFTWGTAERIAITQKRAEELGIQFTSRPILRKPISSIGSFYSLFKGIGFLNRYINENNINIVIPRSTMPSIMVNRVKKTNFKLLFDADGLPIEERVDFSGLKTGSKSYQFFKKEEHKILIDADAVITRSQKSIAIHLETIHHKNSEKFSVVFNGRNTDFFKPDATERAKLRSQLNIANSDKVFVYCGSLGPQYGWDIMISIFEGYKVKHTDARFLILTGNTDYAHQNIPEHLKSSVLIEKVPFELVPTYLNIADVAFAIRKPTFSMQGVAPIKLGEYLLMGIPTIASAGIGDTEALLKEVPGCFLFQHQSTDSIQKAVNFAENLCDVNHQSIRKVGVEYFSIEKSATSYLNALKRFL